MYPERPIVGVGAVIFDGARVLLIKRAHEPLKGEWSLPGGAVDVGEALHAAVVREVREETGLDVEVDRLIEIVERITRDDAGRVQYHFVIADYLCRPTGGRLGQQLRRRCRRVGGPRRPRSVSPDGVRTQRDSSGQSLRRTSAPQHLST